MSKRGFHAPLALTNVLIHLCLQDHKGMGESYDKIRAAPCSLKILRGTAPGRRDVAGACYVIGKVSCRSATRYHAMRPIVAFH